MRASNFSYFLQNPDFIHHFPTPILLNTNPSLTHVGKLIEIPEYWCFVYLLIPEMDEKQLFSHQSFSLFSIKQLPTVSNMSLYSCFFKVCKTLRPLMRASHEEQIVFLVSTPRLNLHWISQMVKFYDNMNIDRSYLPLSHHSKGI